MQAAALMRPIWSFHFYWFFIFTDWRRTARSIVLPRIIIIIIFFFSFYKVYLFLLLYANAPWFFPNERVARSGGENQITTGRAVVSNIINKIAS